MTIGTLAYKTTSKKSLYNLVQGRYRSPTATTTLGTISIVSDQSKFGGYSAYPNGLGYVYANSSSIFAYGSNPFTYEGWFRWNVNTGTQFLFDQRVDAANSITPVLYFTGSTLNYYVNGSIRIGYTWTPSVNQWYHIAISRSGTSTKMFVDGTQVGSTYTDSNSYVQGGNVNIFGTYSLGTSQFKGHGDEIRISNTARYTANFTPSSTAFQNDSNTLLLLHLDSNFNDYVN